MRTSQKLALAVIVLAAAIVSAVVSVVRATPAVPAKMTPLDGTAGTSVGTGKVLNADDKPQQDIPVQLLPPDDGRRQTRQRGASPPYKAGTDKVGQFRIEKVQSGSYRLLAGDKVSGMAIKELTVAADQTFTVELKLRKPKK